jgi:hypothetical protein
MTRARARSPRAQLALAACALWLGGVEVLPAVHQAVHDQLAPHRHDGGSIVTVSFEDTTHRHPDGSIHYVAPKARPAHPPASDGSSHASDRAGHAAGLAHHAAALAPVPPPITRPLPVDRRPCSVAVERSVALIDRDPLAPNARGPPVPVSSKLSA